jgi:predicted DNA-binding transcriptional regulator AlpA
MAHDDQTNPDPDSDSEFVPKPRVKRRYGGVNDMWIHRKMKQAGFPAPVYFGEGTRPFWRTSELIEWENRSIRTGAGRRPGKTAA